MIYLLAPGASGFTSIGRVPRANGNLIGIDFRVKDTGSTSVYGLTDTGKILLINVATNPLSTTVVSTLTPRFAGGFQSLMDFNPVLNAIRIIGSNDQNFAVVNDANGGNLTTTASQTALAYATGDVNFGVDPNISAGTYTNNIAGATSTLFYAIDYDLDTFVTIATKSATGSSNTGQGQLQTIGPLVNAAGAPMNINPTADIDIFSPVNGANTLVGINNETLFTIDLNQINPALSLGTAQKVVANGVNLPVSPPADAFIDIAIARFTTYQAENALLGGGNSVMTNHTGFTGTGFVDFADNVAGGTCEFTLSQTGSRTLSFRYANGSTVNRTCNVKLNGTSVATVSFPPTGSFDKWAQTSLTLNLGTTAGSKVRLTSTTAAGGPNLDRLDVQ
jgi:hypothetical protein